MVLKVCSGFTHNLIAQYIARMKRASHNNMCQTRSHSGMVCNETTFTLNHVEHALGVCHLPYLIVSMSATDMQNAIAEEQGG